MKTDHERIESIFVTALEIQSESERLAYLKDACGADGELRAQVDRLIENHREAGSFLVMPTRDPPAGSSTPDQVGSQIGPYKLLQKLGEGGMGVVFLAEQEQPVRRRVALKVIRAGMDSSHVLARFEHERQALALMDHPNITRVLDAGATPDGRPFFAMELVHGIPITKYCDQERLSVEDRLRLFIPVCRAVQHAHQKGIIHRDLKPSNIIVGLYDGQPVPKVIDFGVAKATGSKLIDATIYTQVGQVIGTLEYMAPEQAELNNLDIDTRADIYSLGVVLYVLLTGAPPFSAEDLRKAGLGEMLRIIREIEPNKPSTKITDTEDLPRVAANRRLEPARLASRVRGELDWITMKCLEKTRNRRYETANGLAVDLERFLANEPVQAGPPSVSYKLRKLSRKYRRLLAATASFTLFLIAAAVVCAWLAIRATRAEQTAEQERDTAIAEKQRADDEAAVATAVNDFLQNDLLGQADIANQSVAGERNKDISVRELLDRAAGNISKKFPGQPRTEAAILTTLGKAYQALGEYDEAKKHLDRALKLRQQALGQNDPDTIQSNSDLAMLHVERSEFDEAEELLRQVLEARQATLGPDERDTLKTLNDLGVLLSDGGRYDEAEPLLTAALEARRAQLGDDDLDTLESYHEVAVLNRNLGRYAEADRLCRQAFEGRRAKLGADHPLSLESMFALGVISIDWHLYDATASKFDEAERLFNELVEISTAKLGADHPETLGALNSLAAIYQETNRYDEAKNLLEQVLNGWRDKLGPNHVDTLVALNNLAALHIRLGRHEEAIPLMEQVLEGQRAKLDPDHVDLLIAMHNLAVSYRDTGRYEQAEPLLTEAVDRAKRTLGFEHILCQTAIPNLADLHHLQGKPEATESLLREIADFHRQQSGPESQVYDDQLSFLFRNLIRQGKFIEAEQIARQRLASRVKNSPDAWVVFLLKSHIGESLLGQAKFADAEPYLKEGYEGLNARRSEIGGSANSRVNVAVENLVKLYEAWGKEDEAAKWRESLDPMAQ